MRKQVPPDKTNSVLEFATKRPLDRLNSICNGLGVRRGCLFNNRADRPFKGPQLRTVTIRP
jgi:hypothetical protein